MTPIRRLAATLLALSLLTFVLADLTYAKVVEGSGGREKMIATMKDTMEGLKSRGIVFRGAKIDPPTEFASADGEMFTVVPWTLEITAPGQKITQRTFAIERPAATPDARGGVGALSQGVDELVVEVREWIASTTSGRDAALHSASAPGR